MRAAVLAALCAALAVGPVAASRQPDDRDARRLAEALAGRTVGPAERCISVAASGPEVIGRTLLYRDGRTTWRSDVADCPSLSRDPVLVVEPSAGQLCVGDRFRTIERGGIGIPSGYCRFGPFTPYRSARR